MTKKKTKTAGSPLDTMLRKAGKPGRPTLLDALLDEADRLDVQAVQLRTAIAVLTPYLKAAQKKQSAPPSPAATAKKAARLVKGVKARVAEEGAAGDKVPESTLRYRRDKERAAAGTRPVDVIRRVFHRRSSEALTLDAVIAEAHDNGMDFGAKKPRLVLGVVVRNLARLGELKKTKDGYRARPALLAAAAINGAVHAEHAVQ